MLVLWIRLECESEIGQLDTFHLILELNLYYELFSWQACWTLGYIMSQVCYGRNRRLVSKTPKFKTQICQWLCIENVTHE